MAEREVVLGLAAAIVSAHVSNNAVPTDQLPTLIQQVFNTLSTVEQASVTPPKPEPAVPIKQSMRADPNLPGLRETVLDAEATSEDRSSIDAAGVPAALGTASIVPYGRTVLCKTTIDPGEKVRTRSKRFDGAENARANEWPRTCHG